MQDYFFRVNPTRTFTDQANITRTVVGISARINSNIIITLDPKIERGFYIDFLLETGTRFGGLNVATNEFEKQMVQSGVSEEYAQAQIVQIVKGLELGTKEQKYAAASALAGLYGYTLAPIEEQNGDPLTPIPTAE